MVNQPETKCLVLTKLGDGRTLTTIRTHTFIPMAGDYYPIYETGVREGKDFNLIQHNWNDHRLAHHLIIVMLAKGWDYDRVRSLMDFLKESRWMIKKARAKF